MIQSFNHSMIQSGVHRLARISQVRHVVIDAGGGRAWCEHCGVRVHGDQLMAALPEEARGLNGFAMCAVRFARVHARCGYKPVFDIKSRREIESEHALALECAAESRRVTLESQSKGQWWKT